MPRTMTLTRVEPLSLLHHWRLSSCWEATVRDDETAARTAAHNVGAAKGLVGIHAILY